MTYHNRNGTVNCMSKLIRIAANAVVAKIVEDDKELKAVVADILSYAVDGAEFTDAFKSHHWSGRSSFFTMRTRTFPAGFVHLVQSELTRRGYRVQVVREAVPAPLGPDNPIVDAFGNDDPRYDYQMKALRAVERHHAGILQIATGGGKSKIAKLIVARYRRPALFLTTRGVLMYQMKEGFEEARIKVGVVGDGVWAPIRGVNVGMVQTLVARLEPPDIQKEIEAIIKSQAAACVKAEKLDLPFKPMKNAEIVALAKERFKARAIERARTIKLLEMIEVVIGEEAHEAGGNSYFEILRHCKKARIRVALTATPFMKDDAADNMRLMAAFGPVLLKVSEKLLIDRGILATPYFRFVVTPPHPKLRKTSPWQRAYQLGYTENDALNKVIVDDAVTASKYSLPTLTLIQRKNHGVALVKAMRAAGLKVEFIQGENDQVERKRALKRLASGAIDVLIGTNILDVGVDVPAVGQVQLAGGGKAEVALRQRIGRGLRAKKSGPNVCFVADYTPDVNIALRDHTKQRRAIVEGTPGFAENILAANENFPWGMFDKDRKAA